MRRSWPERWTKLLLTISRAPAGDYPPAPCRASDGLDHPRPRLAFVVAAEVQTQIVNKHRELHTRRRSQVAWHGYDAFRDRVAKLRSLLNDWRDRRMSGNSSVLARIQLRVRNHLVAFAELLENRDAAPIVTGRVLCPVGLASDRVDRRPAARASKGWNIAHTVFPRLNKMPTYLGPHPEEVAIQSDGLDPSPPPPSLPPHQWICSSKPRWATSGRRAKRQGNQHLLQLVDDLHHLLPGPASLTCVAGKGCRPTLLAPIQPSLRLSPTARQLSSRDERKSSIAKHAAT